MHKKERKDLLEYRNEATHAGTKAVSRDRFINDSYDCTGKYLGTLQLNANGSWFQRSEYLWLDDQPIAQIVTSYGAGNTVTSRRLTYIHTDHLNTPRLMTDAGQTIVWRWDRDAFGFHNPDENPDGLAPSDRLDLRFPGQIRDVNSGLHYNYYRDYDPASGRYMQSDPIGLAGGLNTYAYVDGGPTRTIDAYGLLGSQGHASASMVTTPGVFGCLIGCLSYSKGDSGAQASIEPTIGGGIEICSKPKPEPEPQNCKTPPKNCGPYDPNCDNNVHAPGIPVPRKIGIGTIVGVSVKPDGSICTQLGVFTSARIPLPSLHLGNTSE